MNNHGVVSSPWCFKDPETIFLWFWPNNYFKYFRLCTVYPRSKNKKIYFLLLFTITYLLESENTDYSTESTNKTWIIFCMLLLCLMLEHAFPSTSRAVSTSSTNADANPSYNSWHQIFKQKRASINIWTKIYYFILFMVFIIIIIIIIII